MYQGAAYRNIVVLFVCFLISFILAVVCFGSPTLVGWGGLIGYKYFGVPPLGVIVSLGAEHRNLCSRRLSYTYQGAAHRNIVVLFVCDLIYIFLYVVYFGSPTLVCRGGLMCYKYFGVPPLWVVVPLGAEHRNLCSRR